MATTYGELALELRSQLLNAGVTQAGLEARLLIGYATGKSRDTLIRDARLYVPNDAEQQIRSYLARRLDGEPIAYIVGCWEFMGRAFVVSRDVLIPRSDTETLCLQGLQALNDVKSPRVLDLCCGSGCLGLTVAAERHDSTVVLIDNSQAALAVTRKNALALGVSARTAALAANALEPLDNRLGRFDLVLCNPPYIPTADVGELDHSVRSYEPLSALDGGGDGLDFYRAIAVNIKPFLNRGAHLMFEVGIAQHNDVSEILTSQGYTEVDIIRDLSGIERVVKGTLAERSLL